MSHASRLAQALSARLQTITRDQGALTDVGERVFRGRRRLAEEHIPCIVIVEGDDQTLDQNGTLVKLAQRYIIEGHAACDPDNPNDRAHEILSDIKRAVFGGDRKFDGLVRTLSYAGRAIQTREDGLAVVSASIGIDAEFPEDLSNP